MRKQKSGTYLGGGEGGGWGRGGHKARSGSGAGVAAPTLVPQERPVADGGAVGAGAPARVGPHLEVIGRVGLEALQREHVLSAGLGRCWQLGLSGRAQGAGLPDCHRVLDNGPVALGGHRGQPAQQDSAGRGVAGRLKDLRVAAGRVLWDAQDFHRLLAQAAAAPGRQPEHVCGPLVHS